MKKKDKLKMKWKGKKLQEELEMQIELEGRKDYWLHPDIIVKIQNKTIGEGKYFNQKARVLGVIDNYVAVIQLVDSNVKIKMDQSQLETVLPALGSKILIVNGAHRGEAGKLEEVKVDQFKAVVRIGKGKVILKDYDDICKVWEPPLFQIMY